MLRGNPTYTRSDPTRPLFRPPLTGSQPPLTGGPEAELQWLRWWFGVGLRWSTIVDHRWPPLTGGFGGGSSGGPDTSVRPCGTTQVVTRGVQII
ncbi:hypothetical protein Tco_0712580, partial [Tanacetum coccineum]